MLQLAFDVTIDPKSRKRELAGHVVPKRSNIKAEYEDEIQAW